MRELLKRLPSLQLQGLYTLNARDIHTKTRRSLKSSNFDTTFDQLIEKIDQHPANNNQLFDYMREQSKVGFTPAQYDGFRANYFARTIGTADAVTKALSRAIKEENNQAIVEIGGNLADESGVKGPEGDNHPQLLKDSFNILGRRVFGLPVINFKDASKSPYLLPEIVQYRKMQNSVYADSSPWPTIAGCMYLHEKLAYPMLVNIFEHLVKPYQGYFEDKPEQWQRICKYFDAHIQVGDNGVRNCAEITYPINRRLASIF